MENFEIYENGELVQPSAIERVGSVAINALVSITEATGRAIVDVVRECATNLALDITDAQNGSNLRAQYIEKRRNEKLASIAAQFDLA